MLSVVYKALYYYKVLGAVLSPRYIITDIIDWQVSADITVESNSSQIAAFSMPNRATGQMPVSTEHATEATDT